MGGLFPVLDANLMVGTDGQGRAELRITGAYRPPLDGLGEGLDQAVLQRVAGATLRSLLRASRPRWPARPPRRRGRMRPVAASPLGASRRECPSAGASGRAVGKRRSAPAWPTDQDDHSEPRAQGQVRGMTEATRQALTGHDDQAPTRPPFRGTAAAAAHLGTRGHQGAGDRLPRAFGTQHPAMAIRGRHARDRPVRRPGAQGRPGPRRQGNADLLWRGAVRTPARGARAWLPARGDPVLRAVQALAAGPGGARPEDAPATQAERRMLAALPHRHTHRSAFDPGPIPAGLLPRLQHDALAEGATLALVETPGRYGKLADLAAEAARMQAHSAGARAEIQRWSRPPGSPARDGVPAAAFGPRPRPGRGGSASVISTSAVTAAYCPPPGRTSRPQPQPRCWSRPATAGSTGCARARRCTASWPTRPPCGWRPACKHGRWRSR